MRGDLSEHIRLVENRLARLRERLNAADLAGDTVAIADVEVRIAEEEAKLTKLRAANAVDT